MYLFVLKIGVTFNPATKIVFGSRGKLQGLDNGMRTSHNVEHHPLQCEV